MLLTRNQLPEIFRQLQNQLWQTLQDDVQVDGTGEDQVGEDGAEVVEGEEVLALLPLLVGADCGVEVDHGLAVVWVAYADGGVLCVQ